MNLNYDHVQYGREAERGRSVGRHLKPMAYAWACLNGCISRNGRSGADDGGDGDGNGNGDGTETETEASMHTLHTHTHKYTTKHMYGCKNVVEEASWLARRTRDDASCKTLWINNVIVLFPLSFARDARGIWWANGDRRGGGGQ